MGQCVSCPCGPCVKVERVGAAIDDSDLLELFGAQLRSTTRPEVTYSLGQVMGQGAHGVVFSAQVSSPHAEERAVIKLLRPRAVRELGGLASTIIGKEVESLRRLSTSEARGSFIVRFFDAGIHRIEEGGPELPWVALEHVDGGTEGVTLRARVQRCMALSGAGFHVDRARSLIDCVASGLHAMHGVGVLHRDLNPRNVLCSGSGASEMFKISDFGLARVSSAATFGNVLLGTPGYCAPEQSFPGKTGVGPHSDVFSLACTAFFVLTGEPLFSVASIPEMLVAVYAPERRSLLDAPGTCPALRERPRLCRELDSLLARATRPDPRKRPESARQLGDSFCALLTD
jgi:eukaryotic-like serine/threonine-protein kinase